MSAKLEEMLRAVVREELARAGIISGGEGLLSVAQVAKRFRVKAETVRRWHRQRRLKAMPAMRPLRFRADVVDLFERGMKG